MDALGAGSLRQSFKENELMTKFINLARAGRLNEGFACTTLHSRTWKFCQCLLEFSEMSCSQLDGVIERDWVVKQLFLLAHSSHRSCNVCFKLCKRLPKKLLVEKNHKNSIKSCQIVLLCSKIFLEISNYQQLCTGCLLWFQFVLFKEWCWLKISASYNNKYKAKRPKV